MPDTDNKHSKSKERRHGRKHREEERADKKRRVDVESSDNDLPEAPSPPPGGQAMEVGADAPALSAAPAAAALASARASPAPEFSRGPSPASELAVEEPSPADLAARAARRKSALAAVRAGAAVSVATTAEKAATASKNSASTLNAKGVVTKVSTQTQNYGDRLPEYRIEVLIKSVNASCMTIEGTGLGLSLAKEDKPYVTGSGPKPRVRTRLFADVCSGPIVLALAAEGKNAAPRPSVGDLLLIENLDIMHGSKVSDKSKTGLPPFYPVCARWSITSRGAGADSVFEALQDPQRQTYDFYAACVAVGGARSLASWNAATDGHAGSLVADAASEQRRRATRAAELIESNYAPTNFLKKEPNVEAKMAWAAEQLEAARATAAQTVDSAEQYVIPTGPPNTTQLQICYLGGLSAPMGMSPQMRRVLEDEPGARGVAQRWVSWSIPLVGGADVKEKVTVLQFTPEFGTAKSIDSALEHGANPFSGCVVPRVYDSMEDAESKTKPTHAVGIMTEKLVVALHNINILQTNALSSLLAHANMALSITAPVGNEEIGTLQTCWPNNLFIDVPFFIARVGARVSQKDVEKWVFPNGLTGDLGAKSDSPKFQFAGDMGPRAENSYKSHAFESAQFFNMLSGLQQIATFAEEAKARGLEAAFYVIAPTRAHQPDYLHVADRDLRADPLAISYDPVAGAKFVSNCMGKLSLNSEDTKSARQLFEQHNFMLYAVMMDTSKHVAKMTEVFE
jgi:hypothetical protein